MSKFIWGDHIRGSDKEEKEEIFWGYEEWVILQEEEKNQWVLWVIMSWLPFLWNIPQRVTGPQREWLHVHSEAVHMHSVFQSCENFPYPKLSMKAAKPLVIKELYRQGNTIIQ